MCSKSAYKKITISLPMPAYEKLEEETKKCCKGKSKYINDLIMNGSDRQHTIETAHILNEISGEVLNLKSAAIAGDKKRIDFHVNEIEEEVIQLWQCLR